MSSAPSPSIRARSWQVSSADLMKALSQPHTGSPSFHQYVSWRKCARARSSDCNAGSIPARARTSGSIPRCRSSAVIRRQRLMWWPASWPAPHRHTRFSAGATPVPLRVGPKSSLTQTKLSEHETNRGEAEKSECVSGEIFEILGQAATAIEPREGALDNPASRQKLKPFGVIGAFDDFDFEVRQKFGRSLLKDWPLISAVSKELL